jgi:hypothetical protein
MKNKGSSVSQYLIIIGLVALVLIPVFIYFGQNIHQYFTNFYKVFATKNLDIKTKPSTDIPLQSSAANETVSMFQKPEVLPGSLGGKPDHPIKTCDNNFCIIDYGDFILEGIPKNFGQYVNTHGTSGGTEKLAALIDQAIAQILPQINDPYLENSIINLSKYSHQNGSIEGHVENIINSANNDDSNLTALIENLENENKLVKGRLSIIQSMHKDKLDPNIYNIVMTLGNEVDRLAEEMIDDTDKYLLKKEDPEIKSSTLGLYKKQVSDTSKKTHLDAAIICSTGHGHDTGEQCN